MIRIDPPALNKLASDLSGIAPNLHADFPGGIEACQSWGVSKVLAEFEAELEDQREEVRDAMEELADGVLKTAGEFSEYDAALKADFDRLGSELR